MSNNHYPEPPKLTSAKNLMKRPIQPRTPQEQTTSKPDLQPRVVSPELTETAAAQENEDTHTRIPELADNSLLTEESKENNFIEETFHSETSETNAIRDQIQTSEEKTDEKKNKEEYLEEEDAYGGPWGIIKHTGYVPVALWAALTAVITGTAAYFFAPGDFTWIALGVLGLMTGVIAAVDRKTHLIKNQHTIATAIITVPLSLLVALNLSAWNILFGILAAVLVFGVFIFLILKVNFGSGGDIKFSPVPAFALGVVNPLISALWLFYALIITVILLVVRKEKKTSFGEGMAISFPFAIASVYALYAVAGLPYMEPASL